MPQYLLRKDNTFYFRQVVPIELRPILGRREIKRSLGRDYAKAVRECKRMAVEADNLLADARARFDSIPIDPYSREGVRRTRPVILTSVTPELEEQFGNLMMVALLETDQEMRIGGLDAQAFKEYGEHVEAAIVALRRQLAMGDVEPMQDSARTFLVARGYQSFLGSDDLRRLAYTMARASLQAYEGIAARQAGNVVNAPVADVLPSQYEVQNNARIAAAAQDASVSWQDLYDIWAKECDRRENTKASYLAAMNLFKAFSARSPAAVTRDDVLAYRDFLLQEKGLAPGTVSNKVGFVGTLVNSGRNSSKCAKHLPHNPFENIKIKQSKRGKAGKTRQPFNDAELKTIFGSSIYKKGERPKGGGGDAAAWLPAIAYATGMRLEEIALLHGRQFLMDANGVPYIHTEDGKNDNSADRDVPIHPALISAGLLEYVALRPGRLFPDVKSSDEIQSKDFSKWFGRHLGKLGIAEPSKVFHSFRHLFKDLCRNSGLDDSAIDQICGHEPGTVGGRYGAGRRIDVLAKLVGAIKLPVPLPKIFTVRSPP